MTGYTKKIAVIKQVKGGFSADGGALSGLVKAESYAGFLKVEASLINFAPLSEGKYLLGITDGLNTVTFEGNSYEGESDMNLSSGFAFLVCFCHNGAAPIASAACGQMACALPDLKEEMAKAERALPAGNGAAYDDEAIAGENYYERKTDEGGDAVRAPQTQEKAGGAGRKDEAPFGSGKGEEGAERKEERGVTPVSEIKTAATDEAAEPRLAEGDFYSRMQGDIEKIFSTYPAEEALQKAMEGSRWARIDYGEGKYYVFGVLRTEGKPRYVCYGVPSSDGQNPPRSLKGSASFMPVEGGGYWILYQDASTGVSVKLDIA